MEGVITERLTQTFRSTFGKGDIQLTRGTTAADIKEWDSLMQHQPDRRRREGVSGAFHDV